MDRMLPRTCATSKRASSNCCRTLQLGSTSQEGGPVRSVQPPLEMYPLFGPQVLIVPQRVCVGSVELRICQFCSTLPIVLIGKDPLLHSAVFGQCRSENPRSCFGCCKRAESSKHANHAGFVAFAAVIGWEVEGGMLRHRW